MKKAEETAVEKLRNMVEYFNHKVESINESFRSIRDMEMVYDYEIKHDTDAMFGDEKLWHAEEVNVILGYKIYSTNQDEKHPQRLRPFVHSL